jgi:hypothetical protein
VVLHLPRAIQVFTSLHFAAGTTRLYQRSAREYEAGYSMRTVLPLPKAQRMNLLGGVMKRLPSDSTLGDMGED